MFQLFHARRLSRLILILCLPVSLVDAAVPAFPGAEGFGSIATGGRGGKVVYVTSLEDDVNDPKPGTLRWAIEKVDGPHYVLFKIGGKLQILKPLNVTQGDVTIAAQTAPGNGICIVGGPMCVKGIKNAIVRGLRSRAGDGPGVNPVDRDNFQIDCSHDVIIDHCSFSWSVDESIDINDYLAKNKHGDTGNISVQWCIFGEGLQASIHGIDPGDTSANHSCGPIIWGKSVRNVSLHHNLLANCDHRNPRIGGGVTIESVNNVIYNWGGQGTNADPKGGHVPEDTDGEMLLANIIGNVFIPGPSTDIKRPQIVANSTNDQSKLYMNDNLGVNEAAVRTKVHFLVSQPAFASSVVAQPAAQIKDEVIDGAGALLPQRDSVDQRIANDVKSGTGKVIDSQKDVGGWPDYPAGTPPVDSDNDGMPDDWETAHHLDPHTANANGHDLDKDYDNLEVYLNGLLPVK